jgi:hypothetical protein
MANPATFPRPSRTFAIRSVAHNAAVARLLFADVVGRTPFPGLAKARMELRVRAWAQSSLFDELTNGGLGHQTAVFKAWRVSARNPSC